MSSYSNIETSVLQNGGTITLNRPDRLNRAVGNEALAAKAMSLVQRLANGPTFALDLLRAGVAEALESNFPQALAMERRHQRDAGRSADFAEGVQAFLAKRPAKFEGR